MIDSMTILIFLGFVLSGVVICAPFAFIFGRIVGHEEYELQFKKDREEWTDKTARELLVKYGQLSARHSILDSEVIE